MAGLGYEVNKNLTLEFGYRYLNLGDAQSGRIQNAFLPESYAPLKAKDIDSHDIKIGMRWNFGESGLLRPGRTPDLYAPSRPSANTDRDDIDHHHGADFGPRRFR